VLTPLICVSALKTKEATHLLRKHTLVSCIASLTNQHRYVKAPQLEATKLVRCLDVTPRHWHAHRLLRLLVITRDWSRVLNLNVLCFQKGDRRGEIEGDVGSGGTATWPLLQLPPVRQDFIRPYVETPILQYSFPPTVEEVTWHDAPASFPHCSIPFWLFVNVTLYKHQLKKSNTVKCVPHEILVTT
jgi:hypothetical protein